MPNTEPSVLPVPADASVDWQPPQTLNGHAFVKYEVNGSTVTFIYKEDEEWPEIKTYTVRYDWGESPSDRKLPTDRKAYRSVEQAMDAVDTTFTAGSTSNAQNGDLTGTWTFSGWDNGTLEGTTVVFRGTWRFTPDGGSAAAVPRAAVPAVLPPAVAAASAARRPPSPKPPPSPTAPRSKPLPSPTAVPSRRAPPPTAPRARSRSTKTGQNRGGGQAIDKATEARKERTARGQGSGRGRGHPQQQHRPPP